MSKEYWITPPELYAKLDREFHFDFDPCPYPFDGKNGLEKEWGKSVWLNPPFRKSDSHFGAGPTAFIRKAIEESKKGKTVVTIINTNAFINMFVEAGAEMRSLGRVKWLDGKTGEPWKSPSCTTLFILKGKKLLPLDARITECVERIVIDYANLSGRESANRSEFRDRVKKHLEELLN